MIMGMCIGCSPYNAEQTVITQAIAVLRRFGSDAHIYLPGVGMLNGLQAGNYLDSAGTTVGTVDQPVGLVLDAAGGLGVDVVVNGDFSNGFTGWTAQQPTVGSVAVVGGVLRILSTDGSVAAAFQNIGLVAGKTYKVTFDLVITTGTFALQNGAQSTTYITHSTSGPKEVFITAIDAVLTLKRQTGVCDFTIDNISVREVTGIAASQPTTSAKPILRRGAVNLLTYSGDFSNAAWVKAGSVTVSGSTVSFPVVSQALSQTITMSTPVGTQATGLFLASGVGTILLGVARAGAGTYEQSTAEITLTATPTLYAVTHTIINSGQTGFIPFVSRGTSGTATSVTLQAAALFAGTYTAAQIQSLGGIPLTSTAPASTALGPQYWSFDGSNDSLSLGSVPFQMSDDFWIVGVANTTSMGTNTLLSLASTASATPFISLDVLGGQPRFVLRDDAATLVAPTGVASLLGITSVISGRQVGNSKVVRVNGSAVGTTSQSMGVATINSASIGCRTTTSINNYMNGNIYPIAFGKGTMTDADLLLIEKALGQIAGVQI